MVQRECYTGKCMDYISRMKKTRKKGKSAWRYYNDFNLKAQS